MVSANKTIQISTLTQCSAFKLADTDLESFEKKSRKRTGTYDFTYKYILI